MNVLCRPPWPPVVSVLGGGAGKSDLGGKNSHELDITENSPGRLVFGPVSLIN